MNTNSLLISWRQNRPVIVPLAFAGSMLFVGACTALNAAGTAAVATRTALPASQLVVVQQICSATKPALDVATGQTAPAKVSDIAVYPKAYCDKLLAGYVPETTDANTPNWLRHTISAVNVAAKAARYLLPMLSLL